VNRQNPLIRPGQRMEEKEEEGGPNVIGRQDKDTNTSCRQKREKKETGKERRLSFHHSPYSYCFAKSSHPGRPSPYIRTTFVEVPPKRRYRLPGYKTPLLRDQYS
jgi:hypothetical protein